MTYNEINLKRAETQLELAKKGFEYLVRDKAVCISAIPLFDELEPYFDAVKEFKSTVSYYAHEVEVERAEANAK